MRTVIVVVRLPSNRALTKAVAHTHTHILIIKTQKEYKAQSGLVLPARHCQGPHMHSLLSYFLRSSSLGTRSLKFLPLFFLTKVKNFKLNSKVWIHHISVLCVRQFSINSLCMAKRKSTCLWAQRKERAKELDMKANPVVPKSRNRKSVSKNKNSY